MNDLKSHFRTALWDLFSGFCDAGLCGKKHLHVHV